MDSVHQETENNDSKQEETKVNLEEKIEEQEENFPLHRAVVKRDISKIQSLLATKKFNIDERDWHGNPPIHLAIHLRYLDVVQELLNFGSDPTVKNGGGWSALDEAIASKDKEIIKAIILAIQVKVKQEFKSRIPILIIELQKVI